MHDLRGSEKVTVVTARQKLSELVILIAAVFEACAQIRQFNGCRSLKKSERCLQGQFD